jgi:hypothetical protein
MYCLKDPRPVRFEELKGSGRVAREDSILDREGIGLPSP